MKNAIVILIVAALFPSMGWAELPEGPGKAATAKVCGQCHEAELAASLRQGRDAWNDEVSKMASLGAEGTEQEFAAIVDYLAKYFGPDAPRPINVNKATAIQLESIFGLLRKESAAFIQYRADHGNFKSIDDLRKVPGVDVKKFEAKKDRVVF
jgi:competence protein ComEA